MKNIDINEIVKLKEAGMSNKKIADLLRKQGIEVSRATIGNRPIEKTRDRGK